MSTGFLLLLLLSVCKSEVRGDVGEVEKDNIITSSQGTCDERSRDHSEEDTISSSEEESQGITKYVFQVHVFALGVLVGVCCTLLVQGLFLVGCWFLEL